MTTAKRPCGCEIEMESGKQLKSCHPGANSEREVVRLAWELVLRAGSHTAKWGSFEERLRALVTAVQATGKPEDYGVETGPVYSWDGII